VGRSTALAVLAWHLARQGKKVLAIDLDLEAPGLGSLLLDELPDYGLVDWLVEALVGQPDPSFLQDCLARSDIAKDCAGIVQVMPALGGRTRDYVAKVGRVFLPSRSLEGTEQGLAERLAALVSLFGQKKRSPRCGVAGCARRIARHRRCRRDPTRGRGCFYLPRRAAGVAGQPVTSRSSRQVQGRRVWDAGRRPALAPKDDRRPS